MSKIVIGSIAVLGVISVVWFTLETNRIAALRDVVDVPIVTTTASTGAAGISDLTFTYKTEVYTLVTASQSTTSVNLVNSREYRETYMDPDFMGEYPPSMTFAVYRNDEELSPLAWAEANTLESNFELKAGDVAATTIGEVVGIQYAVDGLYRFDVHIVPYGKQMYMLSGGYYEAGDERQRDFIELLSTVRFK